MIATYIGFFATIAAQVLFLLTVLTASDTQLISLPVSPPELRGSESDSQPSIRRAPLFSQLWPQKIGQTRIWLLWLSLHRDSVRLGPKKEVESGRHPKVYSLEHMCVWGGGMCVRREHISAREQVSVPPGPALCKLGLARSAVCSVCSA